jgi:hypothetical protein
VGLHPYGIHVGLKNTAWTEVKLQYEPFKYVYKTLDRNLTTQDFLKGYFRPMYPNYNNDGYIATDGDLSCPSCHNPHVWDADKFERGPGKNIEGRVHDSFLRFRLLYDYCTDCHSYIFEELRKRKYSGKSAPKK